MTKAIKKRRSSCLDQSRRPTRSPPRLIEDMGRVSAALLDTLREEMESDGVKRWYLQGAFEELLIADVYIKRAVGKLK